MSPPMPPGPGAWPGSEPGGGLASAVGAAIGRIGALLLRYVYLLRGSWPRLVELVYWPAVQLIVWGFTAQFFASQSSQGGRVVGMLVAAVLLWDVLFRAQIAVSVSFLEELWSRNLGHLFVSPLRPWEFAAALVIMSLLRTLIGVVPAALLAIPLYHYDIFAMGLPLLVCFANLLAMGAAIGILVAGAVLLLGLGAESLAWMAVFAIAPISAIYYPVAILPHWLQAVAWLLPAAHVFEGMRAVLAGTGFPLHHFLAASGLNLLLMAAAFAWFLAAFRIARRRGRLLQTGE